MRTIKFRVWCEYEIEGQLHKEMCGPENWFLLTQTGHLMSHGPMSFNPNAEKDYKVITPEFFTGLKDKNGKDLDWWEGDILKSPEGKYYTLRYHKEYGKYSLLNKEGVYVMAAWIAAEKGYTKEGTIHENPELLK